MRLKDLQAETREGQIWKEAAAKGANAWKIILDSLTGPSIRMLCHNGMHILEQGTIVRQPLAACCSL